MNDQIIKWKLHEIRHVIFSRSKEDIMSSYISLEDKSDIEAVSSVLTSLLANQTGMYGTKKVLIAILNY